MEFERVTKNAKSCERLSDGSASDSHGRRLKAGCSQEWLPHIATSRKRWWRFSAVVAGASKGGRRIHNPPDPEGTPKNLPHNSSRRAKK